MRRTVSSVRLTILALGLAAMPAPILSQDTAPTSPPAPAPTSPPAAIDVLPADYSDFLCFTALQARQVDLAQNANLPEVQRIEIGNNLIIISAYYAGRISHYSALDAPTNFAQARAELENSTPQQKDQLVQGCADFYLTVMELLGDIQQPQA